MAVSITYLTPTTVNPSVFFVAVGTFPFLEGPTFDVIAIDTTTFVETALGGHTTYDAGTIAVIYAGPLAVGEYTIRIEEQGNPANNATAGPLTVALAADTVTAVDPTQQFVPSGGTIEIQGTFTADLAFYGAIGDYPLSDGAAVYTVSGTTLEFEVPADLPTGTYDITVWWLDLGEPILLDDPQTFDIVSVPSVPSVPDDGVVTVVAPASNPAGTTQAPLASWRSGLPSAVGWNTIGRGGVADGSRVVMTAASPHGYEIVFPDADGGARLEQQVAFQGSTSTPGWASGASGHVLAIDDGVRTLGVAIGDELRVIHPWTGEVLWEVPADLQPGGWTTRRIYHLVKVAGESWEFSVDGRPVFRLPYRAAALTRYGVIALAWGWLDATPGATGVGTWDDHEYARDSILAPRWRVDRARMSMPGVIQDAWTAKHDAILRATVGVFAAVADAQRRTLLRVSDALLVMDEAELAGDLIPGDGWTDVGTPPTVVRDRLRYVGTALAEAVSLYTFPVPVDADHVVLRAAATFTLRGLTLSGAGLPAELAGPSLVLRDGLEYHGAQIVALPGGAYCVALTSGSLEVAAVTGAVLLPVGGVDIPVRLELVLVERSRLLLFVDDVLVEDMALAPPTLTLGGVQTARVGSGRAEATVDVEAVLVQQAYASGEERPGLSRRGAERLVFAGGCELPAQLGEWLRHRAGTTAVRGTDRLLSELRRLACDDLADRHRKRVPATWFLDVTYPEVTPVFLTDTGSLLRDKYEVDLQAPNFAWADFEALVKRYLLPRGTSEAVFQIVRATELATDVVTTTDSVFTVRDASAFVAGDVVTLRKEVTSGSMMTLEYDTAPTTAADTAVVGVDQGGVVEATWSVSSAGLQSDIGGTLALGGLAADRLAAVTAGNAVLVRGTATTAAGWVEVIGVRAGLPVTERLPLDGTASRTGIQLWDAVHGAVVTPAAAGAVEVVDAGTSTVLYSIADGDRSAGVHLFDPPASAACVAPALVADAACTDPVILGCVEEGGGNVNEVVTLTGVVPVAASVVPHLVRWVAAGYLATARTVTIGVARIHDRDAGTLSIVSSSASDVQRFVVVGVSNSGEAVLYEGVLTGTTPVTLPVSGLYRVLGLALFVAAVGTVTLAIGRSTGIASIAPASARAGIRLYQIDVDGPVDVSMDDVSAATRFAAVVDLDDALALSAEVVPLSTTPQTTRRHFAGIRGLAVGNVPAARTVTASGRAWRGRTWEEVATIVSRSLGWSIVAPAPEVLDGRLDPATVVDVTAGPTNFGGRWSVVETTTVTAVDGVEITTPALTEAFLSGDRIRLGTDE